MNNYIFDREKDSFLYNDDGEKIHFPSQQEVWDYLKRCEFKDDFILSNFYIMKGVKILQPEDIELYTSPQPIPEIKGGGEGEKSIYDRAYTWLAKNALVIGNQETGDGFQIHGVIKMFKWIEKENSQNKMGEGNNNISQY